MKKPKVVKCVVLTTTTSKNVLGETIALAWGRADNTPHHVTGKLTPKTAGPYPEVTGTQLSYLPRRGTASEPPFSKWLMIFRAIQPVCYTLALTPVDAEGNEGPPSDGIDVDGSKPHINRFVTITEPHNGESIDPNDFVAYGDTEVPMSAASVTLHLTDANGNDSTNVPLLYLLCDYTDLHLWCAQFDSLQTGGTYHLFAGPADGGGGGQDVRGLRT
jgi:hypothetical protein